MDKLVAQEGDLVEVNSWFLSLGLESKVENGLELICSSTVPKEHADPRPMFASPTKAPVNRSLGLTSSPQGGGEENE